MSQHMRENQSYCAAFAASCGSWRADLRRFARQRGTRSGLILSRRHGRGPSKPKGARIRGAFFGFCQDVVRMKRLELSLRLKNSDLNAARLPIPPHPQTRPGWRAFTEGLLRREGGFYAPFPLSAHPGVFRHPRSAPVGLAAQLPGSSDNSLAADTTRGTIVAGASLLAATCSTEACGAACGTSANCGRLAGTAGVRSPARPAAV